MPPCVQFSDNVVCSQATTREDCRHCMLYALLVFVQDDVVAKQHLVVDSNS